MKKKLLLQTSLVISITLILGFLITISINYMTFNKVSKENIENISRLTSSNIYAVIDNDLTKPIYVSKTMANDTFLKEWLLGEKANIDDENYKARLIKYLHTFKNKYNYDSVFAVSAKTSIYYYFEGINKIINPNNAHDVWYYDFLNSGKFYDLDVDTDETADDELTVFVNCRIETDNGELLGVVGVGVKMSHLQRLLKGYEDTFMLQAFLINSHGNMQVHTDSNKIEQINFFDWETVSMYREKILNDKTSLEMFWYPDDQLDHCLTTRYIDNLNWYLVVEKDTSETVETFQMLIMKNVIVALSILFFLLLLCIHMVRRHDRIIVKMATTDELTGLPNRKWFGESLCRYNAKNSLNENHMFIMDVDNFKLINDTNGHLFGDKVLCEMSQILKETFEADGIIARWGGDEFIGIFESTRDDVNTKWQKVQEKLVEKNKSRNLEVSISFGITVYNSDLDFDRLLGQADSALYAAKHMPGNTLVYYNDIVDASEQ
ncbi:MAG: diguanylate cyclase [Clostridia bacterium]